MRGIFLLAEFYRRQRGKTQAQVARATGLTQADISAVESGEATIRALSVLAIFYGKPAHFLVQPVPKGLDPADARERAERAFAGQRDRAKVRTTAARRTPEVPPAPDLAAAIVARRGR